MNRTAMTLVELLVALALSAMLMAVLLAMLGQHSRTNKRLMQQRPFEPWKTILKRQMESDYSGCRHVQIQPQRITIDGYSSSDSGLSNSGPSRITWYVVAADQGNWLFRERVDLLSSQPDRVRREFVCKGVNRFTLQTQLSTDVAPGILRVSVDVDSSVEAMSDSDGKDGANQKLDLVLVRHGGVL